MFIGWRRYLNPMPTLLEAPVDKRAFGKAIGDELLRVHGKQRFYSLRDIRAAARAKGFPPGLDPWAFALFASPESYQTYRASTRDARPYDELKEAMFDVMTEGASHDWFNIDMSWLEWPDIDLSGIFCFFDF